MLTHRGMMVSFSPWTSSERSRGTCAGDSSPPALSSDLHLVAGHSVHAYRIPGAGVGPPVLLVHGLGGSANGWVRILRGLARDFSAVYAVDLPGNGFSPLPASGPLTLEEQLGLLHAFCREVVKTPAFVIGNSLGGALSVILASVHPEDVTALALVAPAGGEMTATRRWPS